MLILQITLSSYAGIQQLAHSESCTSNLLIVNRAIEQAVEIYQRSELLVEPLFLKHLGLGSFVKVHQRIQDDLELLFALVFCYDGVVGNAQLVELVQGVGLSDNLIQADAHRLQEIVRFNNSGINIANQLVNILCGILGTVITGSVLGQRLFHVFEDVHVVYDHTAGFAGIHTVRTSNRLHQCVTLHRLI